MTIRPHSTLVAVSTVVLAILTSSTSHPSAQSPKQQNVRVSPKVVPLAKFGPDLDAGAALRPQVATEGAPRQGTPRPFVPSPAAQGDGLAQLGEALRSPLPTLSAPLTTFDGMGGSNPNDTVGDVGPNHFVQAINSRVTVYNKQGGIVNGPRPLGDFWDDNDGVADACEADAGDPVVLYDNMADRWMIAQFSRFAPFTDQVCMAVSMTANPDWVNGYFAYVFDVGELPDYLKFGAWTDGYYMSANGGGAMAVVFDRSNMLNGNPAGMVQFPNVADLPGNSFNVFMPGDLDGTTPPPPGTPGYFYRPVDGDSTDGGADRIELFEAHVDWLTPASSTLSAAISIPVAPYDATLCGYLSFGCVPQPGTTVLLDPVNETGMFRFPYRNYGDRQVLAGNFAVDVSGSDEAGIRWFILENTGGGWGVANQGTYAPQPTGAPAFIHRFMGSAAMDRFGNFALGFTASSAQDLFASARYSGRTPGDPNGLLPQTEFTVRAGTTAMLGGAGGQPNDSRWGDYYAMVVDPVDDCTFWYTGDYGAAGPTRQSTVTRFRFDSCSTDLEIFKTVLPAHPNAGDEIVYTITVHNAGLIGAQSVVVTDLLPVQVGFLANTDSCTGVAVGATGTLTCPIGTIAAGQSKSFEIKARINSSLGGATAITNTASVTSDASDINPENNSISLTHLVNELADVSVTKLCKPDSGPAPAGSDAVCSIFVANTGPSAARLVTLVDTHFASGPFTIGTVTPSQGSCGSSPTVVTCDLGTIGAGATARVDVTITSLATVDVNDVARATSPTPDPNPANNEATSGVSFVGSADLSITKTAPGSVIAGNNLTFTLSVDNAGPSTASSVVVTDTLPAGVTYLSSIASVGSVAHAARIVTWNLGNVAVADPVRTLQITVAVSPSATGPLVNSASVTSSTADPSTANNLATSITTVNAEAGLTLTKTDSPDPVVAGANLSYTLVVGNAGPSTAQDVVVVDTIPPQTTLVSAVGGTGVVACAQILTGVVSCDVGDLLPGQTKTIIVTVNVAASTPNGTVLINHAQATSPTDPDGASAMAQTTVTTSAELWIEKSGTVSAANPAPALTYRITVHNNAGSAPDSTPTSGLGGPSDAQNVVVVDTLPLNNKKMIVQFMSPNCSYNPATHRITCTTPTLTAGTAVTFEIQVQIKGSVGNITNVVNVTSDTADPNAVNNRDVVNNVIQGGTGKGKG